MNAYLYLGDRLTAPTLRGATCTAVRRPDGKCRRGRNGAMLVQFSHLPQPSVVIGQLLRKLRSDA